MAGFIAAEVHWQRLEPVWDSILKRYEIAVLHAKEFHDTKPPFKGWKKVKKRSFADELFAASHGQIYGLSITIRKDTFEAAKQRQSGWDRMSAIGVCFSSILTRIVTDPHIGQEVKSKGVSFSIETGNNNNSGIEQFFHRMSKVQTFEGCLRSLKFVEKGSCRAIQIADFFAFYSRRQMRNQARFSGEFALPACPYLEIVQRHGPVWQRGGFGPPKPTDGHLEKNLTSLDALTAFTRKPFS